MFLTCFVTFTPDILRFIFIKDINPCLAQKLIMGTLAGSHDNKIYDFHSGPLWPWLCMAFCAYTVEHMINTTFTVHADASFKFHASIRWIYLGSWICDRHMRETNSIDTPFIALVQMIYPLCVWPAIYSSSKSPFPRSSLVFLLISIASTASTFTHTQHHSEHTWFYALTAVDKQTPDLHLFFLMARSHWQWFNRWRSPSRWTVSR